MDIQVFIRRRKEKGLSQIELSHGICTQATLSRFENHGQIPSMKILSQLCARLQLDVGDLFASVNTKELATNKLLDKIEESIVTMDYELAEKANSLSHTKWMCKYHIVFTPKYRRKVIYNQYRKSLGEIFRRLCSYKGVEIIEGHLMPDHVHMLVSIPPRISISSFMGYLKGKSSLMMFDKHANLKYKFGNRHFWAEGYYVSTVGLNEATIRKYIQEQEKHDIAIDKLSVKEYEDPFRDDGK